MNTVPAIVEGNITGITGLQERPVYFVTLGGAPQPTLVVKGENIAEHRSDAAVSVKWASKMMKNVNNPLVNIKVLTDDEWRAFRRAATVSFPPDSRQQANLRGQYIWVKMPYVAGLSDADFVNEDATTSIAGVRDLLGRFLNERAWRELGNVVAVDLFTGNNDRFGVDGVDAVYWANRGNIMFSQGSVIGLDPYFADEGRAGGGANLNQGRGNQACLQVLRDGGQRSTFALACVRAVANELHSRMGMGPQNRRPEMQYITIRTGDAQNPIRRIPRTDVPNIFDPFAPDFEQGLNEGIQRLRQYLVGKKQQYAQQAGPMMMGGHRGGGHKALPYGVLERMAFLGWQ